MASSALCTKPNVISVTFPPGLGDEGALENLLLFVSLNGVLTRIKGNESLPYIGVDQVYDRDNGKTFKIAQHATPGTFVQVLLASAVGDGQLTEHHEGRVLMKGAPNLFSYTNTSDRLTGVDGGLSLRFNGDPHETNGYDSLKEVLLSLQVEGSAIAKLVRYTGPEVTGAGDKILAIKFASGELNGVTHGSHVNLTIKIINSIDEEAQKVIKNLTIGDLAEPVDRNSVSIFSKGSNSFQVNFTAPSRALYNNAKVLKTLMRIYSIQTTVDGEGNSTSSIGSQVGNAITFNHTVNDADVRADTNYSETVEDIAASLGTSLAVNVPYKFVLSRVIKNANGDDVEDGSTVSMDSHDFTHKFLDPSVSQVSGVSSYLTIGDVISAQREGQFKFSGLNVLDAYATSNSMPLQRIRLSINSSALLNAGRMIGYDNTISEGNIVGNVQKAISELIEREDNTDNTSAPLTDESGYPYMWLILKRVEDHGANAGTTLTAPRIESEKWKKSSQYDNVDQSAFNVRMGEISASDIGIGYALEVDDLPSQSFLQIVSGFEVDVKPDVDNGTLDKFIALSVYGDLRDSATQELQAVYGSVGPLTTFQVFNRSADNTSLLSSSSQKKIRLRARHSNEAASSAQLWAYKLIRGVDGAADSFGPQVDLSTADSDYVFTGLARDTDYDVVIDLTSKGFEFGDEILFKSRTSLTSNNNIREAGSGTWAGDHGAGFGTYTGVMPGDVQASTVGLFRLFKAPELAHSLETQVGTQNQDGTWPVSAEFSASPDRSTIRSTNSNMLRLGVVIKLWQQSNSEAPVQTASLFIDDVVGDSMAIDAHGKHKHTFNNQASDGSGFYSTIETRLLLDSDHPNYAIHEFFGRDGTVNNNRNLSISIASTVTQSTAQIITSPVTLTGLSINQNQTSWVATFNGINHNGKAPRAFTFLLAGEDGTVSQINNSYAKVWTVLVDALTVSMMRPNDDTEVNRIQMLADIKNHTYSGSYAIRIPSPDVVDRSNNNLMLDYAVVVISQSYTGMTTVKDSEGTNFP